MRIVIDLQCLQNGSRHRGIGRYMLNLAKNMIRQADGDEIRILLNASFSDTIEPIRDGFDSLLPQDRISVFEPLHPVQFHASENDARRIVSEYLRENFLLSLMPDVVLVGSIVEGFGDEVVTSLGRLHTSIPTAAILYDLIPLIFKDEYLANDRAREWYMEKIGYLRQADLLLSISESSRDEGLQHGLQPAERIVNISTAVDPAFFSMEGTSAAELRSRFSIVKDYLLYTGASDHRKNLPRLIEAFARLPREIRASHQLVLGGGMPSEHLESMRRHASQYGLAPEDVILTGHISDRDMVGLYTSAKAFVFPSYHEGFGLPVLEAMHFGLPCVASDRSSVPEVVGLQDALFDPFSIDSIRHALTKVLVDEAFRQKFRVHCPVQTAKFSWEASAARALETLRARFASPTSGSARPATHKLQRPDLPTLCRHISSVRATGHAQLWRPQELRQLAVCLDRSLPESSGRRRLFVDVSALHQNDGNTGIQRVVRNVLKNLPSVVGNGWEILPVFCATTVDDYRHSGKVCWSVWRHKIENDEEPIDPRAGDIFLGLDLHDVLVAAKANLIRDMRNKGVSVYFVVYDLLPFLTPEYFPHMVCLNYIEWLRAVSQADGLIGISRAVADELLAAQKSVGSSRGRPLRIGWFHLGADFCRTGQDESTLRPSMADLSNKTFFLVVATIEPRKGHAQVLEAFEQLWKEGLDFHLVFAGKKGWMVEALTERLRDLQKTEPRLHWYEDLNDAELEYTYRQASGLIAASMGEGYGLPIVEAFHHNCRVIARDLPVFREIGGERAKYFTGTSGQALAAVIKDFGNGSSPPTNQSDGKVDSIDWEESTRQLWDNIGEGNWYRTWMPPADWQANLFMSLLAVDSRFGTQIGEPDSAPDKHPLIVSRGARAGFLLHGPYIALPQGRFKISALGDLELNGSDAAHNYFDVAADKGTTILFKQNLNQKCKGQLFSAEFETQEEFSDVEVRIHVGEGALASIRRVAIQQLLSKEHIPSNHSPR
jgi:glycosyltransferase involved in cell wall biosynthesis